MVGAVSKCLPTISQSQEICPAICRCHMEKYKAAIAKSGGWHGIMIGMARFLHNPCTDSIAVMVANRWQS